MLIDDEPQFFVNKHYLPYAAPRGVPYMVLAQCRKVGGPLRMTRISSVAHFVDLFGDKCEQWELECLSSYMSCIPTMVDVVHVSSDQ